MTFCLSPSHSCQQVVLYHMCETYNERGVEHASIMDLGTGGWNFLLVAVGGTVIG